MNAGQGGTHWGWVLTAFFASLGRFLAATRSHRAVFCPRTTPSIVYKTGLHWGNASTLYLWLLPQPCSINYRPTVHEQGRCTSFLHFSFFSQKAFLINTNSCTHKVAVSTVALFAPHACMLIQLPVNSNRRTVQQEQAHSPTGLSCEVPPLSALCSRPALLPLCKRVGTGWGPGGF